MWDFEQGFALKRGGEWGAAEGGKDSRELLNWRMLPRFIL